MLANRACQRLLGHWNAFDVSQSELTGWASRTCSCQSSREIEASIDSKMDCNKYKIIADFDSAIFVWQLNDNFPWLTIG